MIKKVTTLSGSVYEFENRPEGTFVRRQPDLNNEYGQALRRDDGWLRVQGFAFPPEVGMCAVMFLEPLGEGEVTIRTTNLIASIEED